ncbi:alpha/beta hydrolase [Actinomadura flavalba]|uniref:alpha/beta hydrolase n=1 Tax=Actinomadura flavalba TaxID=1120938 RepID=UPI0023E44DC1|nr:alpha/beta hydrolase [Actinomadura flavalba]
MLTATAVGTALAPAPAPYAAPTVTAASGLTSAALPARYAAVRADIAAAHATAVRLGDDDRAAALARLLTPGRTFLAFDARRTGRAVEVHGDLTRARRIAVLVPGADSTLTNFDAPKWPGAAARTLTQALKAPPSHTDTHTPAPTTPPLPTTPPTDTQPPNPIASPTPRHTPTQKPPNRTREPTRSPATHPTHELGQSPTSEPTTRTTHEPSPTREFRRSAPREAATRTAHGPSVTRRLGQSAITEPATRTARGPSPTRQIGRSAAREPAVRMAHGSSPTRGLGRSVGGRPVVRAAHGSSAVRGVGRSGFRGPVARTVRGVGPASGLGGSSGVAVIAWLGYDSPSTLGAGVLTTGRADDGARALRGLLDGLRTVNPRATVALLCHSYGTVVCARTRPGPAVTDIALYGSPGVPAAHASDVSATARVWAGRARGDWTAYVPKVRVAGIGLGGDPGRPAFGALPLALGGGTHSGYLLPGSAALPALLQVTVGAVNSVRTANTPSPH